MRINACCKALTPSPRLPGPKTPCGSGATGTVSLWPGVITVDASLFAAIIAAGEEPSFLPMV